MKHKAILFLLCLPVWTACTKVTVSFYYSPTEPCAGQSVTFYNTSTNGEDYAWTFGDNATASTKSPNHVYKKPGTYTITVQESKTKKTYTQLITIRDTVPALSCSTDSVMAFQSITYKAEVYNIFQHPVSYSWQVDDSAVVIQGTSLDSSAVVLYYTSGNRRAKIHLEVRMDDVLTRIDSTFYIFNNPAPAILYADTLSNRKYYQRVYTPWMEPLRVLDYARGEQLLQHPADTIDSLSRKVYFRQNGKLQVKNTNGTCGVSLFDSAAVTSLCVDVAGNRLYFSTSQAIYRMPLVHTADNRDMVTPSFLLRLVGINRIVKDNEQR